MTNLAAKQQVSPNVVVLDNALFVDTVGGYTSESDTIQASLSAAGFTVSTFTDISATGLAAALMGKNVLVIPELEAGNLFTAMLAQARAQLQSFVSQGGSLIIAGSGNTYDTDLLNGVFGFSLAAGTDSGSFSLTSAAAGTTFADDPASISNLNASSPLLTSSLPSGSLSLYANGNATAVALMPYGLGQITYLGYDWYNMAPLGAENGWQAALTSAVTLAVGNSGPFATSAETLVNNGYTISDQWLPDTAVLTDGSYVTVWMSYGEDGSHYGIYGRRFNADGTPQAAAFRVNVTTNKGQSNPAIVALDGGGFVVTWNSYEQYRSGSINDVYMRRYNANGTPIDASDRRVDSYADGNDYLPQMTALSGNRFFIAWNSYDDIVGGADTMLDCIGRVIDASTGTISAQVILNSNTTLHQNEPQLATLSNGNFVMTWQHQQSDGTYDIYFRRFSSTGTTFSAIDASDVLAHSLQTGDQTHPCITALSNGGFAIAWMSAGDDGSGNGIFAQVYDAAGTKVGSKVQVNSYTPGEQIKPAIVDLPDGEFFVAWYSEGQDNGKVGVFGQRVNSTGGRVGEPVQLNALASTVSSNSGVNTQDAGIGRQLSLVHLGNGRLVASWNAATASGTLQDVYSRQFSLFEGTSAHDVIQGTSLADTLTGGGGDDTLTGGLGQDTAVFSGNAADYRVGRDSQGRIMVTDLNAADGNDGTDTLAGVESLQFSDRSWSTASAFRVNTTTTGSKESPTITALSDGGFVVTWSSYNKDGSGWDVYGQRYSSAGVATGGEFRVNTTTAGSQYNHAITGLSDGGFVVMWMSDNKDGFSWDVYGQRYSSTGVATGGEFEVNTTAAGSKERARISALSDGGFVVTWMSYGLDGSSYGVYGQRYNSTGVATGAEFLVNTTIANDQWTPAITGLSDGGFVVTWASYRQDGSGWGVYGQRYNSAGVATGGEFRVNATTAGYQQDPTITSLADGGFVVTWVSYDPYGYGEGVYGQRYSSAGVATGGEFRVNTTTEIGDRDQFDGHASPTITGLADGGFVVTWASYDKGGYRWEVYGQRYNSSGLATGGEFRVNTTTVGHQGSPTITGLSDGGFVATWLSDGGVYGQRFDAAGPPLGKPTILLGTSSADFMDVSGSTAGWAVHGGVGNDTYTIGASPIQVTEFASEGMDTVVSAQNYTLGSHVENLTLTGAANLDGTGNKLANILRGNGGNNVLNGGVGEDTVVYANATAGYRFALGSGGFTVADTDLTNGNEGQDTLVSVENIQFADRTWSIRMNEVRVNTTTADSLQYPAITGLSDGGFVVTWESYGQDGSGGGVYGQRYSSAGVATGGEFRVNTTTAGSQYFAAITGLSDGGFVVTWQSYDGSGSGVYGQRYSSAGVATGGEFRVNTTTAGDQSMPAITGLSDGGFVVTWMSKDQDGSGYGVYGQHFSSAGVARGSEFRVNTTTESERYTPTITGLSDGGFVVTWTSSYDEYGSGYDVYYQLYTANGKEYQQVIGSSLADTMNFSDSTVSLVLMSGLDDDVLMGGMGNDILFGDDGADTVIYSGNWSQYTVTGNAANARVTGPQGTDTLTSIELLGFNGVTVATLDAVNDAPVAVNDTNGADAVIEQGDLISGDATAHGNVLNNDADADSGLGLGETKTVCAIAGGSLGGNTEGSYGSLVLNADGSYDYLLNDADPDTNALSTGQSVTDTFTYTVMDAHGATSTATLSIVIQGVNDAPELTAPTALGYTDTVYDDSFAATGGTLSATDVDGDDLSFGIDGGTVTGNSVSITGSYGTLVLDSITGEYTYTPDDLAIESLGGRATDSFTLTVSDGSASASQTLTVSLGQSGSTETNGADSLSGVYGVAEAFAGLGGDDTYTLDVLDTVQEGAGGGTDIIVTDFNYTLGANLENLLLTGRAIRGTGNSLDNALTGNNGSNVLAGGAGNDRLDGGLGTDTLKGDAGNDVLAGGTGNDNVQGGTGDDSYLIARGGGTDTLTDTSGNDVLWFNDASVSSEQLWFRQVSSDLEVSVIGTTTKVLVKGWYTAAGNRVETIRAGDGKELLASEVQTLVSAMAAFSSRPAGGLTLTGTEQAALTPVLAANWS